MGNLVSKFAFVPRIQKILLLIAAFMLISLNAEAWDVRTEIPAITSTRWTVPEPPLLVPTNISRAAYYSNIQSVYNLSLAAYIPAHAGSASEPYQFNWAYCAAFFYKATGDAAWYDLAMRCIRGDMANMAAGGAGGFATPARIAWLLHDTPLMQQSSADQITLHDWMIQSEAKISAFEVGAQNRAIGPAMFRECILRLWPNEPGNPARQDYVNQVWNDWHVNGDLDENSSGYNALSMRYLIWWLDIRGASEFQEPAGMKKLAYRYLEYATPLGCSPSFGDNCGWNSSPAHWIPLLERWAAAYSDGRFRWAAQRQFQWTNDRVSEMWQWGNINYDLMQGLFDAWLYANDSIVPLSPTSSGLVTTRKGVQVTSLAERNATGYYAHVTGVDILDKLIFRDGWQPGNTFAFIELNPSFMGHGHSSSGSVNALLSQGSVILQAPPYLVHGHEFQNAMIVKPLNPPSTTNDVIPWHYGACGNLTVNVPATIDNPQTLMVSFDAKSVSGSRYLQINRPWGGGSSAPIQISPDWQRYTIPIVVSYSTAALFFNPMKGVTESQIANGEFLLDNLQVSRVVDGVPQNENLFINPTFETDITNWIGAVKTDAEVLVARETVDTNGSNGALRVEANVNRYCAEETQSVQLPEFSQSPVVSDFVPWHYGAYGDLTVTVSATTSSPQTLIVSFDAKSVSGSQYLQINRPWGGGSSAPFQISPSWQHYTIPIVVSYSTAALFFNPVASGKIVAGEFLLDNLSVSRSIDGVIQNENLFKNSDLETSGVYWQASVADSRVVVSREITDTCGASNGSLWVKTNVSSPTVGCARLEMPYYVARDVDVGRRIFFLGDKGLWVKDTVKAVVDFDAQVGPAWNFTSIYGPEGANWVNACQVTLPVPYIWSLQYMMQWSNRAVDTLVWFGNTPGAEIVIDDVTHDTTRAVVNQDLMNNTKWRVWNRLPQTLPADSLHTFNSVLMPHAPLADATPLANSISLLVDQPGVTILQINDTQTGKKFFFGMNDNGTPQVIEPYGITTSAKWFKIVYNPIFQVVEDYWYYTP